MKRVAALGVIVAVVAGMTRLAVGYVEAQYTLGRIVAESTNVVVVEVSRVNKEKGLVIYKKVEDLKGKHATEEIKHNIGTRGFHPRESQNVMKWAEVGQRAVFFHNGGASETCIGTYWYQAYPEGEWWAMSHAEPYLMRAYCGDATKLAEAVTAIIKGDEVVVPCMADGDKTAIHERRGKMQRIKASLKRIDYNLQRDFVSFGGDGEEIISFATHPLLPESALNWKFQPQAQVQGDAWRTPDFNDDAWRSGKTPIGYGEPEIEKRQGVVVAEQGVPFLFRKSFDVPADVLGMKNATFRLRVASDNSSQVFLNGHPIDDEGETDHEFAYWNRDVEIPVAHLRAGRNVVAVMVRNRAGSSDLFFDLDVSGQTPVVKKDDKATAKPTDGK